MIAIVTVILPVFGLIFLGKFLKNTGFPGATFWAPAEKLVYWICFPALLTTTLAQADFSALTVWPLLATIAASFTLVSIILLLLRRFLPLDGPVFTSLYQSSVRFNTYIGLTVALALHGATGLAISALIVALFIPLVNLGSVLVLIRYGANPSRSLAIAVRELLRNPLILACLAGIVLNVSGSGLPPVIGPLLEILARAALPLGLLAVGAALDLAGLGQGGLYSLLGAALKLLLMPLVARLCACLFGLPGTETFLVVLFAALPTAPTAYILARQLGGNSVYMANLVSLQTLLAMLTLPVVLVDESIERMCLNHYASTSVSVRADLN